MATARITSKGQITLPREVREHFHLREGDRVEFVIERGGQVRLRPVTGSIRKLFGMLRRPERSVPSLKETEEALLESVAEDDARIRRIEEREGSTSNWMVNDNRRAGGVICEKRKSLQVLIWKKSYAN